MPPAYGSTAVPLLDEHAGPVAAYSSRLRKAAVLVTIVAFGYIATNRFQPPASAQAVLSAGQTSHAYSKDARSMHMTKKDAAKPTCTNTLPKEWQPYIRREGGYYGRNLDDAMTNVHPDFSDTWTPENEKLRVQSIKSGWKEIKEWLECAICPPSLRPWQPPSASARQS